MSKPSRLFGLVALFALAVACSSYWQSPAAAQFGGKGGEKAPSTAVTKWEYRIVTMRHGGEKDGEKELNKLGEEGFEIAFVTGGQITREISASPRGGGGGDSTPIFQYTLKRAK